MESLKLFAKMKTTCNWDYLYRQLAEECCELAQASMKYIRAKNDETPISVEEARAEYIEEMADVLVMLDIAAVELNAYEDEKICETIDYKRARLDKRLEEKRKRMEEKRE